MIISAIVSNEGLDHRAVVRTGDKEQPVQIPGRMEGSGSSVNGGELLFLALATCYCNDLYREAKERGLEVSSVEVEVCGRFGRKGEPAEDIRYSVTLRTRASEEEALDLIRHTDSVAEVHNTLRLGTPVTLGECKVLRA